MVNGMISLLLEELNLSGKEGALAPTFLSQDTDRKEEKKFKKIKTILAATWKEISLYPSAFLHSQGALLPICSVLRTAKSWPV